MVRASGRRDSRDSRETQHGPRLASQAILDPYANDQRYDREPRYGHHSHEKHRSSSDKTKSRVHGDVAYRHVSHFPENMITHLHLSKIEVLAKLDVTTNETLYTLHKLQADFNKETALLSYAKPDVLNHLWEDKIGEIDSAAITATPGVVRSDAIGVYSTLKEFVETLYHTIDAFEHSSSMPPDADVTMADKLRRSAQDIERSRGLIGKKKDEAKELITNLEIISLVIKGSGLVEESRGLSHRPAKQQSVKGRKFRPALLPGESSYGSEVMENDREVEEPYDGRSEKGDSVDGEYDEVRQLEDRQGVADVGSERSADAGAQGSCSEENAAFNC